MLGRWLGHTIIDILPGEGKQNIQKHTLESGQKVVHGMPWIEETTGGWMGGGRRQHSIP
jgi:hypothetical protein